MKFKIYTMVKFQWIFSLTFLTTFNLSFCQDVPMYNLEDLPCFTSVMKIGAKVGYWDTSLIKPDNADCYEYFNQRIFNVVNDTLSIVKVENSLRVDTNFFGLKAVIVSDTLITATLYFGNTTISTTSRRLKKKEGKSEKLLPFQFKVVIHDNSCKVGL
jgi:hypothetical protein